MKVEELRALLRQHAPRDDETIVDAFRLKNGQILGVVLVGRPLAGNGVKLIIEEREHGKSNPQESTEARGQESTGQEAREENPQEEKREASRRRKEGPSKGRSR